MAGIFLRMIFMVAVAAAFAVAAYAKEIAGSVQSVDPSSGELVLQRTDLVSEEDTPDRLTMTVHKNAAFRNFASLDDLKVGSQIIVDASKDETLGTWEAKSVELLRSDLAIY